MYIPKFLKVNPDDNGLRLDKFIYKSFSNVPFSIIQKKIRTGFIRVNGLRKRRLQLNHLDKVFYKGDLVLEENKIKKFLSMKTLKLLLKINNF